LVRSALQIKLGDLTASTEKVGNLIECCRNISPLEGRCLLNGFLDKAKRIFSVFAFCYGRRSCGFIIPSTPSAL